MVTDTDQKPAIDTPVDSATDATTDAPTDSASEAPKVEKNDKPESEAPAVEVQAYKPDYKLKVYDEEKELDDPFLKALIKDADTEKKVKEIAQKYLGFETVKNRHEKTKTEYQKYQENTQPVVEYYNQASNFLKKGDLDSFFDLLKIPTETIFRYAVQKAEEEQLPHEQKAQIYHQRQVEKQKEYLEGQNQTLMQAQQRQLTEFRAQELNWVMARPDVSGLAQSFDQKVGRPGAFRQAVIDKGLAHYAATNGREDLSAEQATQEVLKLVGAVVTPTTTTTSAAPLIQQNGAPPIIPNVTGRGTSPVKKQVRSLQDLKKKREELFSSS